ncbi:MAG: IS200/IS605 family transposase [Oligoflexia bacterium]|nr:IS200/IS605 family transposase [Oligoflexia bacterium]
MKFHRSSHSVFQCIYHIVWTTKYRKRALKEEWHKTFCKNVIRRAAKEFGMRIHEIEVDVDHVHLHIEIPPQRSVGSAVRIMKSFSARLMFKKFGGLKQKFWAGELWSRGYFVRTVGDEVTAAIVRNYILAHAEKGLEPAQGILFPKGKD